MDDIIKLICEEHRKGNLLTFGTWITAFKGKNPICVFLLSNLLASNPELKKEILFSYEDTMEFLNLTREQIRYAFKILESENLVKRSMKTVVEKESRIKVRKLFVTFNFKNIEKISKEKTPDLEES